MIELLADDSNMALGAITANHLTDTITLTLCACALISSVILLTETPLNFSSKVFFISL